jgi:hypothetical protein
MKLAAPPENPTSWPALFTVALLAMPNTVSDAPLSIVVALAVPPTDIHLVEDIQRDAAQYLSGSTL